ncbi:MAG: transferrin receptor-like dimerization domain-containing protein [Gemmatimonadales bacterium]
MSFERSARRCLGALLMVSACPVVVLGQSLPVRGFTTDSRAKESQLEQLLRATPDSALLREYMLFMSEEPHHAGSARSKAVAEYALEKFKSWGLDAHIEEYEALLPTPVERQVELLGPTKYVAKLQEPQIPEDKDSGDLDQLPTYNAYAADGDVTGELVFVNYGIPSDYDKLAAMGVDVTGKIVIAKYGRSWRGIKPKVAAEHGAIACILYSDPEDDGYYVDDVYPAGPMRPEMGVQRGSVMDMPTYPGDPLTPGWGSKHGGRKLDRQDAKTLMSIPVLPISYGDALPLLEALGGKVAPNDDWKGALPITYHVGPGPARVRVRLSFDWKLGPLYDVIVRIKGSTYPDQWVIHGNHHDAWVNGAQDPISGAVTLMESARSFAKLLKTGWRPQRTIILALWDGEEWGLLGSTEWAEDHAAELEQKAVMYFNSDTYSRGWLGASGSHTLETFIRQVARDTKDPKSGKNAIAALVDRDLERAQTAEDSTKAKTREFRLGALGSGSDYTVFIDHLAIASINLSHGGGQRAGIYHSIYDSYDFYTRFLDPGFVYGQTQAGTIAVATLRMADATVLPFSFSDAAATYGRYVEELEKLAKDEITDGALDLSAVEQAVGELAEAGAAFDSAMARVLALDAKSLRRKRKALGEINREIYLSERDLATPSGLPRREWFQHIIYAPGFYTGYGVKTMPGIREAVEQKNLPEATAQTAVVADAIMRMVHRARDVASRLNEISGR